MYGNIGLKKMKTKLLTFLKKIIRKNNEKKDKNKISYQEMIDQYDYEGSPKFKKRKKILTQYLKKKCVLDDDKVRKQDE